MMKLFKDQAGFNIPDLKVVVYWGDVLYDTYVCRPDEGVTVGHVPGNMIVLPQDDAFVRDSIELVKVDRDHSAILTFDEYIDGHVYLGKEFLRLDAAVNKGKTEENPDGTHRLKIGHHDQADFVIGHLSFYLEWEHDKHVIARGCKKERKKRFILAGLLALALLLSGIFLNIFYFEEEKKPERLVTVLTRPKVRARAALGQRKPTKPDGASKKASGKAKIAKKPRPSEAEKLKKVFTGDLVRDLADIGNVAPVVTQAKPDDAITAVINQASTGGSSTKGFKTGAGGKSEGIGRIVGKGEGGFEGTGRLGLAGNSISDTSTGRGMIEDEWAGGLDKDVIDAIVRKKKDRIRLCYERQLNFKPTLAGKVTVHFVIGASGKVIDRSINEDTMKNDSIDSCILNEVKTWIFPKPKGGTKVKVDYPFVFESSVKK